MSHTTITLFSDGAARGNPGPAGCGAVLFDDHGQVLDELSQYLGDATNNQAEYKAMILGVSAALSKHTFQKIKIYADSELLVKQILGQYRVKNEKLKPLYQELVALLSSCTYTIAHVRREKNTHADRLANLAIDNA